MNSDLLKNLKPREKELVERYPIDRWHVPVCVDVSVDGKAETRYACRICGVLEGLDPEKHADRLLATPGEVEEHIRREHTNGHGET